MLVPKVRYSGDRFRSGKCFLAAVFSPVVVEWGAFGRMEHHSSFVIQGDFLSCPVGGDDRFRQNRLGIRVVGGYTLTDAGPWRVDRLESIDVEWGIGHWRGSTAQTALMRSRKRGRMAREVVFSGGWIRRISVAAWPRFRQHGPRHRICRSEEPAALAIVRLAQGTD